MTTRISDDEIELLRARVKQMSRLEAGQFWWNVLAPILRERGYKVDQVTAENGDEVIRVLRPDGTLMFAGVKPAEVH